MFLPHPEALFEEIYAIYQAAFPAAERRTKEGQRAVLGNPAYRMRGICEPEDGGAEGALCAFIGYWELESGIFLEHLATVESCRGKGYGRMLIEECIQEGREKGKPLFLEIEPVDEADPMTGRREAFYHRCGFFTNDFYYEQMPLKEGDKPIPLWVMSWPKAMEEKGFLPYKREIYREVYGVVQMEEDLK